MNRQNFTQIAKWAISIAILWVLTTSFDFVALSRSVLEANVGLLVLAWAIDFTSICLSVLRWRVSLAVQGIRASFPSLLNSTLVSGFLGFLLPSFGEDAVRGYDLYKANASGGVNIAASILFERICGLLGHVIVGTTALSLYHDRITNRSVVHFALILYGCILVALFIVFSKSLSRWLVSLLRRWPLLKAIGDKAESLTDAIQLYRQNKVAWLKILGLSLVFQFSGFLYFYVIATALGVETGFSTFVLLVPIVIILSLMPISVGGLGVKEGLFVVLFTQLGVARESAFLTSAVGSTLHIAFVLLGGLVFLLRKKSAAPAVS